MISGFYMILMEIPEPFFESKGSGVTFASLMSESIKTTAYIIDVHSDGQEENLDFRDDTIVGEVKVNFKPRVDTYQTYMLLNEAKVPFCSVGKQVSAKSLQEEIFNREDSDVSSNKADEEACIPQKEEEYVLGEFMIEHIPTGFDGFVKGYAYSQMTELMADIKKDFPEYGRDNIIPMMYKVLMKLPKSFVLGKEYDGTILSLLNASTKTRAYIIEKRPGDFEKEEDTSIVLEASQTRADIWPTSYGLEFVRLHHIKEDFDDSSENVYATSEIFTEPSIDGFDKSNPPTLVYVKPRTITFQSYKLLNEAGIPFFSKGNQVSAKSLQEEELKSKFGTFYEANKDNPEVVSRLKRLSSKLKE